MEKSKANINISKRQNEIIKLLSSNNDYVTADAISKKMGISLKTVYRELEILKDLQENMGFVLNSKIGKGFKISFDVKSRETIQKSYVQEARYLVLKNYLLRTAPKVISLEELSNMFFISKASILSDLKKVDYDLKKYNLIIIKHNKGVTIEGTEFEIRRALANSIIKSDYKEADFLDSFSSRFDETTRISLCSQFSSELVDYIEQVVKEIEKDLGYEITDPYYINIVTHLLIMVLRLMRGRPLETEKPVLLSPDIHKMRIAFSIANKIEKRYRINIPDNDVRYIYEHLESIGYSKERIESKVVNLSIDNRTKEFAYKIIELMKNDLYITKEPNEIICKYFLLHIHSMIGRIKYQIDIKCSILNDIVLKKRELFEATKKNTISALSYYYPNLKISDDEIGFLTIYLQSLIESEEKNSLRIIVVCSSSVGTSHMLSMRIKKKFPDWQIVDQLPSSKLNEKINDYDDIDLILSTVKLQNYNALIPIVYVSVLLDEKDICSINDVLKIKGVTNEWIN